MAERNMEKGDWYAKVLRKHFIEKWEPRYRDFKDTEVTFIVVWDKKELRYLVIVDFESFRQEPVPPDHVLIKFKELGFDYQPVGAGRLEKLEVEGCVIKQYFAWRSDSPIVVHDDLRKCLGL